MSSTPMNYQAAKEFILEKLRTELAGYLSYHSVNHTLDVLTVAQELADELGIDAHERTLLCTAALFHDSGFTISMVEHERLGCEIVRHHLPHFSYTEEDIERICGMIMATKIPQSPQNQLEEILCDADLDYLGRDDFYSIGNALFHELLARDIVTEEEEWNRIQVRFLESHQYFTTINQDRRSPRKLQHLEELKSVVAGY